MARGVWRHAGGAPRFDLLHWDAKLREHTNDALGRDLLVPVLTRFKHIVHANLACFGEVLLVEVVKRLPNLESIECGETEEDFMFMNSLTNNGCLAIAEHCHRLTSITISDSVKLQDSTVIAPIKKNPSLEVFRFRYCRRLTDAVLDALAQLPQLTVVDVEGWPRLTDKGMARLAERCPQLTDVNISNNHRLSDSAVVAVSKHCSRLTLIDFSECDVTDASLRALGGINPLLRSVRFVGCVRISDDGVINLVKGVINLVKSGSRIEFISARACHQLTDAALVAVAANCPQLTSVDFAFAAVTDAGVAQLAAGCHQLTDVDFVECHQVGDVALLALASNCPRLSDVHFKSTRVTDAGVVELAERCSLLEMVNFSMCLNVTDTALLALEANCPRLWYALCLDGTQATDAGLARLEAHCDRVTERRMSQRE